MSQSQADTIAAPSPSNATPAVPPLDLPAEPLSDSNILPDDEQLSDPGSGSSTDVVEAISMNSSQPFKLDEFEEAYQIAVREGNVPDTELSRVVFKHQMRFPDAILLTRVGSFYEVESETRPR